MKVTELRIGNFVSNYPWTELLEVTMINKLGGMSFNNILFGDVDKVQAIPITEEWLIKFGFKQSTPDTFKKTKHWYHDDTTIWFEYNLICYIYEGNGNIYCGHIKNIHQLQNLYFALVGEELIYNG